MTFNVSWIAKRGRRRSRMFAERLLPRNCALFTPNHSRLKVGAAVDRLLLDRPDLRDLRDLRFNCRVFVAFGAGAGVVVEAGAEDGAADRGTTGAGAVAVGDLTPILAGVKLALGVCFSVQVEAAARRRTREAIAPITVPGAGAVAGANFTAASAGVVFSPVVGLLVVVAGGAGAGARIGMGMEVASVAGAGSSLGVGVWAR